jgi:hypothetical protein
MKVKQLLLSLVCIGTASLAQETECFFEQFIQDCNDLENPISVNNNLIWDDPNFIIPGGFDYQIFNTLSDEIIFNDDLAGVIYNSTNSQAIVVSAANVADRD